MRSAMNVDLPALILSTWSWIRRWEYQDAPNTPTNRYRHLCRITVLVNDCHRVVAEGAERTNREVSDYYRQNPESFSVVYGTDLANDYLNDLIELFKSISPKYILFSSTSERTAWDLAWGHINVKEQLEWLELFEKKGYRLVRDTNVPTSVASAYEPVAHYFCGLCLRLHRI